MNPIARELNDIIEAANPHVYGMLSSVGKNLFFPRGILSQGAEAKEKAYRFNATIGMATEKGRTMHLPSIMRMLDGIRPRDALTYAPSFGVLALREKWRESLVEKNPSLRGKTISTPIVTNAITHGLSVSADMWVDPGDTVVLPDKMWGNYNMIFGVRKGAVIVTYPLFDEKGRFHLRAFEECVTAHAGERQKVIVILNFPNNPTGYTISPEEGDGITEVLTRCAQKGNRVIAFTDDAYFGLFYDGSALQESIFCKLMGRDDRLLAVKLDGATKENYVWGLRVGFITYGASFRGNMEGAYEALEKKTAGAVRGSISNASRLGQEIVLRSMESGEYAAEKQEKYQIMKERAREVKSVLSDSKYARAWDVYPFNSGYFMCLKLKTVSAEPLRVHLLDTYGVGLIALGESDLRVAFSCIEKEDVRELFDTVLRAVQDLES